MKGKEQMNVYNTRCTKAVTQASTALGADYRIKFQNALDLRRIYDFSRLIQE